MGSARPDGAELTGATTESKARVLEVANLGKSFGGIRVLDGVSFALHDREILGVIGPSGGGKTTLLRCLDLLEQHDQGTVDYLGAAFRYLTGGRLVRGGGGNDDLDLPLSELRRHIGYVFQLFNLWEDRTVLQNLCLAPWVVLEESRARAEARALELLGRFGLRDRAMEKVWKLSGGQRQRVAIVRALMMAPRILLCDEITSALDPLLAYEVLEMIRSLRNDGLAMLIVTHHIEFAATVCDRLAYLDKGRILQIDTPARVLGSPAAPEIERFLRVLHAVG
jgi:ABC-type polar amino acid transport system ATPase subunit